MELFRMAIATLEDVRGTVPNFLSAGLMLDLARGYAPSRRLAPGEERSRKRHSGDLRSQRATLAVRRKIAECEALREEARSNGDRVSLSDVKRSVGALERDTWLQSLMEFCWRLPL